MSKHKKTKVVKIDNHYLGKVVQTEIIDIVQSKKAQKLY